MPRKAAVLDALWQVPRTPPGSETRACAQRGNSETWESQLSPCERARKIRGTGRSRALALVVSFRSAANPALSIMRAGDTKHREHARYRGRIAKSEQTREGLLAVLADHSTDGSLNGAGKVGK